MPNNSEDQQKETLCSSNQSRCLGLSWGGGVASSPALVDGRGEQSAKHHEDGRPLLGQERVAGPDDGEEDVEKLACCGDQRVDQRPKPPDGLEDEQLSDRAAQAKQDDVVAGLSGLGLRTHFQLGAWPELLVVRVAPQGRPHGIT